MKPVQTKDTISATTKLIDYVLTKNNSEIEKWLIDLPFFYEQLKNTLTFY